MAGFATKSGSNWEKDDLKPYHIKVIDRGARSFFGGIARVKGISAGVKSGCTVTKHSDWSGNVRNGPFPPGPDRDILNLHVFAKTVSAKEESAVDDYAKGLLTYFGYDNEHRTIRLRHRIDLLMSGHSTTAETDACLMKHRGYLMLLQEDKILTSHKDPEPQVIAQAIAAFQANNQARTESHLKPLDRMVVPCITMIGVFPTFYLVPVTLALSNCVAEGTRPPHRTDVLRHIPTIYGKPINCMRSLTNRRKILRCFQAFKTFVDNIEKDLERE